MDGNRSPHSPHGSIESGYFLRSGKNVFNGGLGKDSQPVSCGRGHKYFLEKEQSQARKNLNEGKQLSIERVLRAMQAQKKGRQ